MRPRCSAHYDMAGYAENSRYDYEGNLVASVRQLAADYHQAVDWTPLASLTTAADLDAAAAAAGLVPTGDGGRDRFAETAAFDALNRPVQVVTPHSPAMKPDVIQPGYDEAGLLSQVDAWLQQAAAPAALLDPATADRHAVTAIGYNARGQRVSISYGNGTGSAYAYDPQTFRLAQLTTTRPGVVRRRPADRPGPGLLLRPGREHHLRSRDDADTQNVIFFRNQRVEPSASYTYDPLYRLIAATGREHLGQTGGALSPPAQVTNDDSFRMGLPQPGDGNAMGTYTETYSYDPLGNILAMAHRVDLRQLDPPLQLRRGLADRRHRDRQPADRHQPARRPGRRPVHRHLHLRRPRQHDAHAAPGLADLGRGRPAPVHRPPGRAAAARRRRPTTPTTPAASGCARRPTSRPRRRRPPAGRRSGSTSARSRSTASTPPTARRSPWNAKRCTWPTAARTIALVETRTTGTDKAPAQLVRYQHGNHLGSAVLELDDQSSIISYEEYFPFGSTSYQAVASQTDLPKRYRYTGKERDEENDLYYHGARYYAPWLGRWTSCDPLGLRQSQAAQPSLYAAHGA